MIQKVGLLEYTLLYADSQKRTLEKDNVECVHFRYPKQLLKALKKGEEYDALLVDCMLDDGYNSFIDELGLKIRKTGFSNPIFLWTSMPNLGDVSEAGFDLQLPKKDLDKASLESLKAKTHQRRIEQGFSNWLGALISKSERYSRILFLSFLLAVLGPVVALNFCFFFSPLATFFALAAATICGYLVMLKFRAAISRPISELKEYVSNERSKFSSNIIELDGFATFIDRVRKGDKEAINKWKVFEGFAD